MILGFQYSETKDLRYRAHRLCVGLEAAGIGENDSCITHGPADLYATGAHTFGHLISMAADFTYSFMSTIKMAPRQFSSEPNDCAMCNSPIRPIHHSF